MSGTDVYRPSALILDLDGTLYPLRPMRQRMLAELCVAALGCALRLAPLEALRIARGLKAFRHMREGLRDLGLAEGVLEKLQYSRPAEALGCDQQWLRDLVQEWMMERPLKHLRSMRPAGLRPFMEGAQAAGIPVAVFSDYPPWPKLQALGIDSLVNCGFCATDSAINAFKPHPAGFQYSCQQLGVHPETALYVGDRDELDGVGARAAGMGVCVLQGGDSSGTLDARGPATPLSEGPPDWVCSDLGELATRLGIA